MVDFVKEIAEYARNASDNPEFGIFPQNGDSLASHPDYVQVVTGIGREDLWYLDNIRQPSDETSDGIANLDKFKEAGKLVLVIDYPTEPDLINDFYSKAVAKGYIPYATVRLLDQLVERHPQITYPTTLSNFIVTDLEGQKTDSINVGSGVHLGVTLENTNAAEHQPFVLILEVRDSSGITVSLELLNGTVGRDEAVEISAPWMPEEKDSYEFRSFVLSDLDKPVILSSVFKQEIRVS